MFELTAQAVVDIFCQSYNKDAVDKYVLEEEVAAFLTTPMTRHLQSEKHEIVNEILKRVTVSVGEATELTSNEGHVDWFSEEIKTEWNRWPLLRKYLAERIRLPVGVITELDRSTDKALGLIENPQREGRWDRRGMVMGHVQSGKTTHYSSLVCKALDAGYRAVIILAGIHDNLRSQTQARVDEYVTGRRTGGIDETAGDEPFGIKSLAAELKNLVAFEGYKVLSVTSADQNGDFKKKTADHVGFDLDERFRLVMVVKKNAAVLGRLTKWLQKLLSESGGRIAHPTLFIDDEADNASINVKSEDSPSSINKLVRKLLGSFQRVAYVGYTATPFANIFIDDKAHVESENVVGSDGGQATEAIGSDLFPKDFIINLKAPTNYIGPDKVFGHSADDFAGIPEQPPLPIHIPVTDHSTWLPPKHKGTASVRELPGSLEEAIRAFILACAVRRCRDSEKRAVRAATVRHNSMLVHVTRFTAVQKKVCDKVQRFLFSVQQCMEAGGPETRRLEEEALYRVWLLRFLSVEAQFSEALDAKVSPLPEWTDLLPHVHAMLPAIQVFEINGKSEDALAYEKNKNGLNVIAIGGDKLSRGLTLEGLSVSYFLRGTKMYDTLMQMGRWFGYRDEYIDVCRVYTPSDVYEAFREISLATEELRREVDRMAVLSMTPSDFGLQVRVPNTKQMMITARNKIRAGKDVVVRFSGEQEQSLLVPLKGEPAEANRKALEELIRQLSEHARHSDGEGDTSRRGGSTNTWNGISAEVVLQFLESFTAYRTIGFLQSRAEGASAMSQYIRERLPAGELVNWTVSIVSGRQDSDESFRKTIGGHSFFLAQRSGVVEGDRFRFRSLTGSADEAIGLSREQYERVKEAGSRRGREVAREQRDASCGLLLLFAIKPFEKPDGSSADGKSETGKRKAIKGIDYIVAAAVSFPKSKYAEGATKYKVNTVMARELESFCDDEQ